MNITGQGTPSQPTVDSAGSVLASTAPAANLADAPAGVADAASGQGWDFFERIYCISLASRPDRQQQAMRQFDRVGLGPRVRFMLTKKIPGQTERGIHQSHLSCLREGLESGARHILVFEDDVRFEHFSPTLLQRAVDFMRSRDDWNMFSFGCFVNASRPTVFASVLKVRYRCLAHAYVLRRPFAEKVAATTWTGVAFDDLLRSMAGGDVFALYPAIAYQSGSASDNDDQPGIDRARRMLGGMRRLQKWNQFSNRHFRALVVGHLLAALGLIALACWHWGF